MREFLTDFITDLIGRTSGPMHFRIYLQPLVATAFALRDGIKDAHEGRPPYGWAVLSDAAHRGHLLRDGWKSISRVFVVAYVLDIIYQFVVLHGLHPLQAISTGILLALVPYTLLRGPINRLTPRKHSKGSSP